MKFYCKICDKSFREFVLFEGHFDFSDSCRVKQSSYIQCYICSGNFRNSAALKYHMQQHTIQRVKKVKPIRLIKKPQVIRIPKITLEKQWNFKVMDEKDVPMKNEEPKSLQLECRICGIKFQSLLHLAQHSPVHEKKVSASCSPLIHEQNEKKRRHSCPARREQDENAGPASSSQTNEKKKSEGIVSVPGNPNQCTVCKLVLRHGWLENHMQFHIDGKFKCNICNIKFSKQSLAWHRKKFHRIQNHQPPKKKQVEMSSTKKEKRRCKICKAVVKTGDVRHIQNHRTGKFKWEICNIRFSYQSLKWHRRRFHPEIDKHKCTICKATLKTKKLQERHLLMHKIGQVKCDVCNIRFTKNSLVYHKKKFHPDLARVLFVKQACSICKMVCRTKAALHAHADMHENGNFQCEEHQIKFTFEALKNHNSRFHAKKSFTCPTCKLKFSGPMRLEQHKKVHTLGYVNCEICSIPFTSSSLIHHQKISHRELYYGVMQSERNMRKMRSQKLIQSPKILQSTRFQCSYCKLLFNEAKSCTHVAVHTEGDVECHICKIPFTKYSLLFHEKRFHADDMRKNRILKAIHRHRSDELQAINGLETKDIPAILEDQYNQLMAENKLKDQCLICKLPCGSGRKLDFHQKRFHPELYEKRIANGIRLMKEHCGDGKENKFSEKKSSIKHQFHLYCDICKVYVGGIEKMGDHKQTHITGDAECKVCQIRFTVTALRYHQKRFHPSEFHPKSMQKHKCTECKLKFSDSKSFETHKTVHIDADTQCDICNIPFTVPSLRYHMKRFHADSTNLMGVLRTALERNNMAETAANVLNPLNLNQCPICNVFCGKKRYHEHIQVHIDGDVKCSVCQIWFTQTSLDYHNKRVHPGLDVAKENRNDTKHQCSVCKLVSYDESRLREHMKVHRGNVKCQICDIPFTKPSLVYHYKRFHPNLTKNEWILKSIENSAPRKNLHSCSKCGKSFTRICYLNLHIKYHRNAVEPVEIPFVFKSSPVEPAASVEIPFDFSAPLSAEPNSSTIETAQIVATVKRRNYECYVCKQPFVRACQLQDHLYKHLVYEQWVDPFNVHLSNWDPDELGEIISEQPLVLVENLDMQHINLKMLKDIGRPNENSIRKLHDVNENVTESNQNSQAMENDCAAPDTTQNDCDDVVEILSDSEDECETIRYQLNMSAKRLIQSKLPEPENCTNEPVCISSDDEDNYDITDSFHCYFCNRRFVTLVQFGEHGKICHMKGELDGYS